MALVQCPNCSQMISDKVDKCPSCGVFVNQYVLSGESVDEPCDEALESEAQDAEPENGRSADCLGERENNAAAAVSAESSAERAKSRIKALSKKRSFKIAAPVVAVILVVAFLFGTHIICFHNWAEATCTQPETCTICGRTQGEALGHIWKDATCTEAKRCERCGKHNGDPRGHKVDEWHVDKEPSCSAEGRRHGTCTVCGDNVEESIGKTAHTPGDWEVTEDIFVTSSGTVMPGTKVKKCKVCGKVVNTTTFTMTLTTSQKNALITAGDYLAYSGFSYSGLIDQLEYEGFSTEDATFAADHCDADWNMEAWESAESYLNVFSFSRSELIHQLEYEGFTSEQAAYAADRVGL